MFLLNKLSKKKKLHTQRRKQKNRLDVIAHNHTKLYLYK